MPNKGRNTIKKRVTWPRNYDWADWMQTYSNKMPSFKRLSDKDVADVLTFIRGHFNNKEGAVSDNEVAAVRAK